MVRSKCNELQLTTHWLWLFNLVHRESERKGSNRASIEDDPRLGQSLVLPVSSGLERDEGNIVKRTEPGVCGWTVERDDRSESRIQSKRETCKQWRLVWKLASPNSFQRPQFHLIYSYIHFTLLVSSFLFDFISLCTLQWNVLEFKQMFLAVPK